MRVSTLCDLHFDICAFKFDSPDHRWVWTERNYSFRIVDDLVTLKLIDFSLKNNGYFFEVEEAKKKRTFNLLHIYPPTSSFFIKKRIIIRANLACLNVRAIKIRDDSIASFKNRTERSVMFVSQSLNDTILFFIRGDHSRLSVKFRYDEGSLIFSVTSTSKQFVPYIYTYIYIGIADDPILIFCPADLIKQLRGGGQWITIVQRIPAIENKTATMYTRWLRLNNWLPFGIVQLV